MREGVVAAAIEAAIRRELVHADQPLNTLRAIADELRQAFDAAAEVGDAAMLHMARSQFDAALRKIWQEYGGGMAFWPVGGPSSDDGQRAIAQ